MHKVSEMAVESHNHAQGHPSQSVVGYRGPPLH